MKALLVSVNGKRICLAGMPETGVLATHVTWSPREQRFAFNVSGLDDGEYRHWKVPAVSVGDEVTIRILEVEDADPPHRVERHEPRTK